MNLLASRRDGLSASKMEKKEELLSAKVQLLFEIVVVSVMNRNKNK
jgi:hypothetical protein